MCTINFSHFNLISIDIYNDLIQQFLLNHLHAFQVFLYSKAKINCAVFFWALCFVFLYISHQVYYSLFVPLYEIQSQNILGNQISTKFLLLFNKTISRTSIVTAKTIVYMLFMHRCLIEHFVKYFYNFWALISFSHQVIQCRCRSHTRINYTCSTGHF